MEQFDFAVMGGGPAGLSAAIGFATRAIGFATRAAGNDARVVVLEKMHKPGRKLLASGSGQCNLSHGGPIRDFLEHYGVHGAFLKHALMSFDNEAAVAFFAERNLPLEEVEGGKIFPASRRALDVLDALTEECVKLGIEIRTGTPLLAALRAEGGFHLDTPKGGILAKRLCLASGGKSYPATGSAGEGYAIAAALGHSIVEPGPALAPLYPEPWAFADCAGFALRDAEISVWREGRKAAKTEGDVLFTHKGLSGPGILDFSRSVRRGDEVRVAFLRTEASALDEGIRAMLGGAGAKSLKNCLAALGLPDKLLLSLLAALGIDGDRKAADFPKASRRLLVEGLSGYPFKVARLGGWEEAMATRGGVELTEVDPKTMESRNAPGLYFAGELLDVDGDTGGYNLQAAFSTGMLAGKSAASVGK